MPPQNLKVRNMDLYQDGMPMLNSMLRRWVPGIPVRVDAIMTTPLALIIITRMKKKEEDCDDDVLRRPANHCSIG